MLKKFPLCVFVVKNKRDRYVKSSFKGTFVVDIILSPVKDETGIICV
jgi:hypothetical protein